MASIHSFLGHIRWWQRRKKLDVFAAVARALPKTLQDYTRVGEPFGLSAAGVHLVLNEILGHDWELREDRHHAAWLNALAEYDALRAQEEWDRHHPRPRKLAPVVPIHRARKAFRGNPSSPFSDGASEENNDA